MKRFDWKRYKPLGRKRSQPIQGAVFLLIIASIEALTEICVNIVNARNTLYVDGRLIKGLIPGAVMPHFFELIDQGLNLFPLVGVFLAWEVFDCYRYHRKDTRSIYIMRRLPDKWELHRRCWGIPVLFSIGTLLVIGGILLLCFFVYLILTPPECLPF